MEEVKEEVKKEKRNRLSPEATIILTIGGFAIVAIVLGIIQLILKGI